MKNTNSNLEKLTKKTFFSAFVVSMSSFIFGMNLCILSTFKEIFCKPSKTNFEMSENEWTFAVSIICIGALISNFAVAFVKLNRKSFLIISGMFNLLGQLILRYAINSQSFIFGRFVIGLGAGITTATSPLYNVLLAPKELKGIFGSFHQLFTVTGIFFAQIFSFYFNNEKVYLFGMNLIITLVLIQLMCTFFIKPVIESSSIENKPICGFFGNRESYKSLFVSICLHAGQQLSGIRAVIFYSAKIFKKQPNPKLCTAMIGISLIIGTILSMFVVDNCGRKRLLIFSTFFSAIFLTFLAFEVLTILGIFGFIVGYSLGLGPIPWFITGELFPQEFRKAGNIVGVSFNWLTNYVTAMFFPGWLDKSTKVGFLPFFGSLMVLEVFINKKL